MWNRNRTFAAIGLVLAASFVGGLLHLLALRAETGTFYPPYSTFRADPLGARAFFESMQALPGLHVDRNLAPIRTLGAQRSATCLFLGDSPGGELPESVFEMVEEIPSRGGRLVIAFAPEAQEGMWEQIDRETEEAIEKDKKAAKEKDKAKEENDNGEAAAKEGPEQQAAAPEDEPETVEESPETAPHTEKPAPAETSEQPAKAEGSTEESGKNGSEEEKEPPKREYAKYVSVEERWGAGITYTSLEPDGHGGYTPLTAERQCDDAILPESLAWHSAMYFKNVSDTWRTIYAVDTRPVAIERDYGMGTIVFLSDSFPFSNEALRQAPHPGLLAWVVGSSRRVIFDETHLGIQEGSGVMVLARQYRMHGLFIGLAVLALLYVWKSTCPLTPRYEARGEGNVVVQAQGRDALSGLANLLKRSIPTRELLDVCLTEWRQAFGRSPKNAKRLEAAERIAARTPKTPLAGADTVEAYQNIVAVLSKRGQ